MSKFELKMQSHIKKIVLVHKTRTKFFGVLFSCMLHAIILWCIFFSFNGPSVNVLVNRSIDPAHVILMPFAKSVSNITHNTTRASFSQKNVQPVVKQPEMKTQTHLLAIAEKKLKHPQKVNTKRAEKKIVPVACTKKESGISLKQVKKINEEKKVKIKPMPVPEIKNELLKNMPLTTQNITTTQQPVQQSSVVEPLVVGLREWHALHVAQEIDETICKSWKPPAGIMPSNICTLLITIKPDGIIQDIAIQKSSGMVAYDIAARNCLYEISFPRAVWGKQIAITFN